MQVSASVTKHALSVIHATNLSRPACVSPGVYFAQSVGETPASAPASPHTDAI